MCPTDSQVDSVIEPPDLINTFYAELPPHQSHLANYIQQFDLVIPLSKHPMEGMYRFINLIARNAEIEDSIRQIIARAPLLSRDIALRKVKITMASWISEGLDLYLRRAGQPPLPHGFNLIVYHLLSYSIYQELAASLISAHEQDLEITDKLEVSSYIQCHLYILHSQ
jgi:hypothetical protein